MGININVARGNHGKIIALIFAWFLRRYYLKASYRFLYLPLPPSDHSQYKVTQYREKGVSEHVISKWFHVSAL